MRQQAILGLDPERLVIDAKLGKMWIARKPYERIDFAEYAIAAETAARPVTQLAA